MAERPMTASHRAVSIATYRQAREWQTAALARALALPDDDATKTAAAHAARQAIAEAEVRLAALESAS
jgi:hypothetical protein